ncbi:endospore germination permease [Rummeliibacillus suwonensis]|nr:endospore germination permease [Rummeliibacillus suwonensis]
MKSAGSISILHTLLLVMTFIGLKNHVTIIPSIIKAAGRDGWASVFIGMFAAFIWLFLLVYVHNKSKQQPIKDWLKQKIGKVGSSIVLYSTVFYLIVLAAFTMRETLLWVSTTFLPKTPMIFLLIVYVILTTYLATSGIETITIVNTFVLFAVIIFGFFVSFVNIKMKDYELLLPFFEHGFKPIIEGMIYPTSGFIELLLLLFLQHHIKERMKWYHFTMMLLVLVGLTSGPLIGAIVEFGPVEAAKQRYPAYEEWGLATIGRFIEHIDFFSIYQWLTGTFIRVGFLLYICSDILNLSEDKKQIWTKITPPFMIACLVLVLLKDNVFQKLNEHYFLISTLLFFLFLSVFFAVVAWITGKSSSKDKNDKKSGEQPSNKAKSQ